MVKNGLLDIMSLQDKHRRSNMNKLNSAANVLPQKGVLFLGGHQNMTKKLRQQFPKWTYITDDQFNRKASLNQTVVFYWTGHSSHKMMRFVYSRLPEDANIIYVTATNLPLLIAEMQSIYQRTVS